MRASAAVIFALVIALTSGPVMAFFWRPGGAPQTVASLTYGGVAVTYNGTPVTWP